MSGINQILFLTIIFCGMTTIPFAIAAIDCDETFRIDSKEWEECNLDNWAMSLEGRIVGYSIVTLAIAAIVGGLWLWRKKKKQGKNGIVGTMIFAVGLNVIILAFMSSM